MYRWSPSALYNLQEQVLNWRTYEVWGWPVNVLTLLLGRLCPLSSQPVLVHILLSVTDNCPAWISRRGKMTVDIILWLLSMEVKRPSWRLTLDLQSDMLLTSLWSPATQLRFIATCQGIKYLPLWHTGWNLRSTEADVVVYVRHMVRIAYPTLYTSSHMQTMPL